MEVEKNKRLFNDNLFWLIIIFSLENEIEKLCSEREFLKLDNIHLITRVKTLEMEQELDKR